VRVALLLMVALGVVCPGQEVRTWLTTPDRTAQLAEQKKTQFLPGTRAGVATVTVDDTQRYQRVEGFGASMTDSSAYLLRQKLAPGQLEGVMKALFSVEGGIGVEFLRNPMGASDLARYHYSYDDLTGGAVDPELKSFSIDHDKEDILPLLRMAKALSPRIKMMGSPWSAPGWMKTTNSLIGGSLLAQYYPAFAQYFVKYAQAYAAEGVPVDYLTLQNEPGYLPANYPGMDLNAATQRDLLREHVLPALQAAGLRTQVMVYDWNWDNTSYAQTVLNDAAVRGNPLVAGTAWHWYGGPAGAMETVQNAFPEKGQWVTEASGGTWVQSEIQTDFETLTLALRSSAKSYVKWGLALDQNRGPHAGGCGTCTPLVTVNTNTGEASYPIDYYTLGHFSKFVRSGAERVWSSNAAGLVSVAFVNEDRRRVLVVYNETAAEKAFQVAWRGSAFEALLPAFSGATYQWAEPLWGTPRLGGRGVAGVTRPAVTPLEARSQIQASSYSKVKGLQAESCTDADLGYDLGFAAHGSWARFDNVDFGAGVANVDVRVASAGAGARLEFRLDAVDGPLVATAELPPTGGWQAWRTVTAPVTGAKGWRTLYVVFQNATGSGGLGNLNWFRFR